VCTNVRYVLGSIDQVTEVLSTVRGSGRPSLKPRFVIYAHEVELWPSATAHGTESRPAT